MTGIQNYVREQYLTTESGILTVEFNIRQFVVYNPTSQIIKLGVSDVDANSYQFIVAAKEYFVSPVLVYPRLSWFMASYVVSKVNPLLIVYANGNKTPQVTTMA